MPGPIIGAEALGAEALGAEALGPAVLGPAVRDYLRHLAVERGLSRNTTTAYRRDLERYAGWLAAAGIADPAAVSVADVERYARWLSSGAPDGIGVAASSAARMLSAVRGLHRFLVAEGRAGTDPAATVTPPALPSRLPKAIGVDEMARLLAATDGEQPQRIRDKALLELLYATGARVSEAVGLSVDDLTALTDDEGFVRLTGKGGKTRVVPVGGYARAALDAYLVRVRPRFAARGRGGGALFLGVRGHPLSRQSAWAIIQGAAERAGLAAHVSPHTFRHSFATHLLAGGADVRVVQELLGHASVATTQIYTRVTIDSLRDVYLTAHPRAR